MSMYKSLLGAGCITMIVALTTACSNNNMNNISGAAGASQPSAVADATAEPAPPATARPVVTATQQPAARSVSLIPIVPEYSESGRGYEIDGVSVQASYSADQALPLGVFLPETMIRFEHDGRTAWGTPDKLNYITLIKHDTAANTAGKQGFGPGNDPQLLQYKEYLGRLQDGDTTVETFEFTAMDQIYRAEFHIQQEERAALLPVFVSMLRDVEYMEKKPPITPGVFFSAPDVGNDPGKQQALQETMNCIEAWSAGDKEKFAAAMYSEQLNEGLQFLLDNKNVYHFNELTVRGIPMEGAKRAAFIVNFQRMTSEGFIIDGSYEISLLKNKEGEWKIANID